MGRKRNQGKARRAAKAKAKAREEAEEGRNNNQVTMVDGQQQKLAAALMQEWPMTRLFPKTIFAFNS